MRFVRALRFLALLLLPGGCGLAVPLPDAGSEVAAPVEFTTLELSTAVLGQPYERQLDARGGRAPLTFTVASGSRLPPGLQLRATGLLAGTPRETGRFTFGIDVTDREGGRASAGYLLVVDDAGRSTASTCAAPVPVALSGEPVVLEGSFEAAVDIERVSCTGSPAREQVYVIELAEPADLVIEDLRRSGTTPTVRAVQTRCGAAQDLACQPSSGPLVLRRAVGRLFLVVESPSSDATAAYAVELRKLAPTPLPPNDRCDDATSVTFTNQSAPLPGTLRGATRDPLESACGFSTGAPDVWYSVPVDVPSRLSVSGAPGAQLFAGACTEPRSVACLGSGQCADVDAGTYLLRLSGNEDQLGSIRREPIPRPPAHDTCTTATPITLTNGTATVSGRLWGARKDLSLPCSADVDVMYELVLAERSDVRVVVTSGDGSVSAFITDSLCTGGCDVSPSHSLRAWALPAGSHRLVVQGSNRLGCWEGRYTASIEVTPSAPAPPNDRCATAEDVVFSNGLGVVNGTTTGGASDDSGGCSQAAPGPDVYYRLTLSTPTRLRVIPTSAFTNMTLSLSAAPCGSTPLVCSRGTNLLETGTLAAGAWFLVVDGVETPGPFQLLVQQFQ
ncbi:MAG: Ig domain-containing protein [Myxococcaceae bacterium]|nr:Ig domain-containing protein [Myxococcaceae bacterium]